MATVTSTSTNNSTGVSIINFARGHPNKSLLPLPEMQEILQKVALSSSSSSAAAGIDNDDDGGRLRTCLNYPGADRGDAQLLAELRAFLERHCNQDDLGSPPLPLPLPSSSSSSSSPSSAAATAVTTATTDLFMSHGVSHGLDILCTAVAAQRRRTHSTAGDVDFVVLMERPTYFLAANIFKSHGFIVDSLPMKKTITNNGNNIGGGGGIDVDRLESILLQQQLQQQEQQQQVQQQQRQRPRRTNIIRMIYIIPTHQNPTGRTMSLQDRWQLAILARRFGIIVLADEVYHLLDWRGINNRHDQNDDDTSKRRRRRPARMAVIDSILAAATSTATSTEATSASNDTATITTSTSTTAESSLKNRRHDDDVDFQGCCVSVSSFTKIFAPGVRCGWIEGPKYIIDSLVHLGYIVSQGGCVPLIGEIMYTSLTLGYSDKVLVKLQTALEQRCRLLFEILSTESGICLDTSPLGGYFIWISFCGVQDTNPFLEYCVKRGVQFLPGTRCDINSNHSNHYDNDKRHSNIIIDNNNNNNDDNDNCQQWARLCFADLGMQQLKEGATLLISCYHDYLQETTTAAIK